MSASLKLTRRDVLWLLGGGAVGAALSPLPWKLLDDTAIWTQSGPHVAKLPRGPVTTRFAHCPLCPAGCGLRLRCVGDYAVGLAGVPGHPRSDGKLCALGVSAHHLRFHRQRMQSPLVRSSPDAPAIRIDRAAAAALAAAWLDSARRTAGGIALLDARPGRAVSRLYRRWLAAEGGSYVPAPEWSPCDGFGALVEDAWESVGIDLARTRTLLVFGAPPDASPTSPGRWQDLRDANPELEIVVLGPVPPGPGGTRVRWLALANGSESALALAIARVVLEVRPDTVATADLGELANLARSVSPEDVAVQAGWAPGAVRDLALELLRHGPVAVLPYAGAGNGPFARSERQAILALNLLLGSAGRAGGLAHRNPRPDPGTQPLARLCDLAHVPDGSLRLLLIDACDDVPLPPRRIRRKLALEGRLVCFSPFATGFAREADLALPAPAPFEGWMECPARWDAAVETYALVAPLAPAHPACVEPVEWLQELAGLPVRTIDGVLRDEAGAIAASGRGDLFQPADGARVPTPADGGEVWEQLALGGCWIDAPAIQSPPRGARPGADEAHRDAASLRAQLDRAAPAEPELALVSFAPRAAAGGVLPPVCAKVYRETGLLPSGGDVFVHPRTASAHRLHNGCRARLASAAGSTLVHVRIDAMVPPGIVLGAVGPDPEHFGDPGPAAGAGIAALCDADDEFAPRATPVCIEEA